ncbi:protein of unknown function DUF87 [Methanothermus fervidus DSM 2088]|uniref:Helicase HerA central domain-containing protein n=1 Tax=Methanothermus fervidus (strain ATCC 43054 / DSM 2088 / JCM 10308 / V24 S) TaxID=523846 RepID=E3GYF8_METFV|nr:ATP-binding protein [Methanothermus fervidus]ADP77340.1 protein of unknown function DUF87 [Methanothermus fervidus DSM 2088]
MDDNEVAGQIIGGNSSKILVRGKFGKRLELGDLLIADENNGNKILLQVKNLEYRSQIPQERRELISGLQLEHEDESTTFIEPELRNYIIAEAKPLLYIHNNSKNAKAPKSLPPFFKKVRRVKEEDLKFLSKPKHPLYLGEVRSGSQKLNLPVYIDYKHAIPHHILIPATTGRGKSNLVKVMLWNLVDENVGILVLDPHDEYYGRGNTKGLKDHPRHEEVLYYSPNPPRGGLELKINKKYLKPKHFQGTVSFTDAQWQAMHKFYKEFKDEWIIKIEEMERIGEEIHGVKKPTIAATNRKLNHVLSHEDVFVENGRNVIEDIVNNLEKGKIVIIDTSQMSEEAGILVGSAIIENIFRRYQRYKAEGELNKKPVIGIVVEEAPRILGKDVLKDGQNIYATIAREGRKFNIGLIAITQLVTPIPKSILANMNTKIILGNEMPSERSEIIGSSPQDLSDDDRAIASLDKGEAIVSSIFTKFAVPIYIPLFEDYIEKDEKSDDQEYDIDPL